jgi:sulfur-oxidizing protein SoxY
LRNTRRDAIAAAITAPWWLPALNAFAQGSLPPLDARIKGVKAERGGLFFDIPVVVETGSFVPITLFVEPKSLATGVRVARFGVLTPLNPRPIALEIELGKLLTQWRIETNIRLGASQTVVGVAQLTDGTLWQQGIAVVLTGSACYDGT